MPTAGDVCLAAVFDLLLCRNRWALNSAIRFVLNRSTADSEQEKPRVHGTWGHGTGRGFRWAQIRTPVPSGPPFSIPRGSQAGTGLRASSQRDAPPFSGARRRGPLRPPTPFGKPEGCPGPATGHARCPFPYPSPPPDSATGGGLGGDLRAPVSGLGYGYPSRPRVPFPYPGLGNGGGVVAGISDEAPPPALASLGCLDAGSC